MKKIFIITLAAIFIVGNYGCKKFLDQVPNDRLTFDESFATRTTVEQLLANVYSTLPDEMQQRFPANGNTAGAWTGASDEADYTLPNSFSNNMNSGNWDATTGQVNTMWQQYYRGIQASSNFIANVGKCTDCNISGTDLVTRYKNEARAIRAIYYYYLLRQYGPVVLLGNEPIAADAALDVISKPRSSFDECVNFIVSELDASAANLPAIPASGDDYGHVNKAVIQAYKVQVLLTAASPLFNGNTDYSALKNADGIQLISQTTDQSKWKKAADAAKAFITTFPNFTLYTKTGSTPFLTAFLSCRDVMLTDWNSEVIFAKGNAGITTLQYDMAPNHAGATGGDKGGSFLSVSQQMVRAYFMANGKSTDDPNSGYVEDETLSTFQAPDDVAARQVSNMYVNREPRFYVGITYSNRKWINPNSNIITSFEFNGNAGKGGISNTDYSGTGYTQRKNLSLSGWSTGGRTNIYFRLAEIYLNYVEALNESNPGDPDILVYLNKIRERAGVPTYGNGAGQLSVPTDMRDAIRRERRVELAFESHRYFDTRRWKIAETTNKAIFGLDIQKNLATGFYKVVQTESRVFDKKHYLWPIPNGEIQKVPLLVQNTGW
ncbi:MAG: RagB/SusD family nutrient uptake outer membrane protein [Pedobacter sp.]|nr:RagB/SusD family nutrient uptake outer membrane protein [Pedobacter sp.]